MAFFDPILALEKSQAGKAAGIAAQAGKFLVRRPRNAQTRTTPPVMSEHAMDAATRRQGGKPGGKPIVATPLPASAHSPKVNPVVKAALDHVAHKVGVSSPPHVNPRDPKTNQRTPIVKATKQQQTTRMMNQLMQGLDGGTSKLGSIHVPLPNIPAPSTVDPQMWANSLVEAQYGPVVAEIHRQMQNADRASTANLANLNAGYSQLQTDAQTRANQNAAASASEVSDIGNLGTSLANSFGVTDPGLLASTAGDTAIQQAYARMMGTSGAEFSRNMQSVIGGDKMSAIQGEQARLANQQGDLSGDLQTTLGERGSRLLELTQSAKEGNDAARQQTFENQMNRSQMQGDIAKTNADLQGQNLKNQMAKAQFAIELSNLPQDMSERALKLAGMRADIAAQKKQTSLMGKVTPAQRASAAAAKAARDANMTADERKSTQQVLQGVRSIARWPTGAWRVGLEPTWKRINAAIQTAGLKPGTPAYKAAQRQAAALVGIQLGPKGNPVGRIAYHKPKPTTTKK